jgi:AcrR family transcriptional regulator
MPKKTQPTPKRAAAAKPSRAGKRWERRSEARPAEIVAAATSLFTERGFGATRMDDVAARAGVTKGTVYLYFQDKGQLFEAVVRQKLAPNLERARMMVEAYDGSTPTLIRMLAKLLEGLVESEYSAIAKMIIAESGAFPELPKLYAEVVLERGFNMMASIIQRGIDRGEFRPVDPTTVVPLVVAPFILLAVWKHSLGDHTDVMPPPSRVLDEHVEMLLRALKA